VLQNPYRFITHNSLIPETGWTSKLLDTTFALPTHLHGTVPN